MMQKEEIKKKLDFLLKHFSQHLNPNEDRLVNQVKDMFDSDIPVLDSYVIKAVGFVNQAFLNVQSRETFLDNEENPKKRKEPEPEEEEEKEKPRKRVPLSSEEEEGEEGEVEATETDESTASERQVKLGKLLEKHRFDMSRDLFAERDKKTTDVVQEFIVESKSRPSRWLRNDLRNEIEQMVASKVGLDFILKHGPLTYKDEERNLLDRAFEASNSKLELFVDFYLSRAIDHNKTAPPFAKVRWFSTTVFANQLSAMILKAGLQPQEIIAFRQIYHDEITPLDLYNNYQQFIHLQCRPFYYPHFFRYLIAEVKAGRLNF